MIIFGVRTTLVPVQNNIIFKVGINLFISYTIIICPLSFKLVFMSSKLLDKAITDVKLIPQDSRGAFTRYLFSVYMVHHYFLLILNIYTYIKLSIY